MVAPNVPGAPPAADGANATLTGASGLMNPPSLPAITKPTRWSTAGSSRLDVTSRFSLVGPVVALELSSGLATLTPPLLLPPHAASTARPAPPRRKDRRVRAVTAANLSSARVLSASGEWRAGRVRGRRRVAPRGPPRPACPHRCQGRLQPPRPRRMLHRPGRRGAAGRLRHPGPPRRRPRHHDHRGTRRADQVAL